MPITRTQHEDHEHIKRSVKEEILGLRIDDTNTNEISVAFGWKSDEREKIREKLRAFSKLQDAMEELHTDLPKSTFISTFADFLKSNSFKELNIKIESPNDYFLLGFLFCDLVVDNHREQLDKIPEILKMLIKSGKI